VGAVGEAVDSVGDAVFDVGAEEVAVGDFVLMSTRETVGAMVGTAMVSRMLGCSMQAAAWHCPLQQYPSLHSVLVQSRATA